ncbi:hypothetical protein DAPPUDRAFT_333018 [Daphnia pulex]|uniref:Uncharacterized protein n=1 Tax=Daphnia pulex TaxID=6669 RepID=E9HRL5_DAPPU|nr:hypothetical protein DAPPUDRAFT_333018 [Daphnia pulex]|eukprot:EFX65603.1 hypothetical protein DAPPUDRAFT_333018 [Daphnia pulex]
MGSESPDVWPRTAEISFSNTEVTRHEFYECFEHDSNESDSIFDAVSRLPGRAICVFRIGFKTVNDHIEFLNKFSAKESVVISGKEVKIRVRDRSVNLVRVRIQHFKFDDDLSLLNKRLREYGVISRIFWDTYQDRSLPRWNGIKTGIVNVDMEIHKSIPSYITFGSYKEPIMVSYAGQMHTCRMCDSPTHVLANCPKQPLRTTVRKPQETGPIGGGQMPIAPTVDADTFPELAQRPTTSTVVVLDGAPEDPISKPDGTESSSDTDADAEDTNCVADEIESGVAQLVELGSPTREVPVSIPGVDINSFPALSGGNDVPPATISPGVPSIPSTIDQMDNEVVEEMDATEVVSISIPDEDISFSGGSIQPGQRPLDSQKASHVSETQESLGVPLGTPSTPVEDKTLKAMEAVRRKKAHDNKTQPSKPKFKY